MKHFILALFFFSPQMVFLAPPHHCCTTLWRNHQDVVMTKIWVEVVHYFKNTRSQATTTRAVHTHIHITDSFTRQLL